MLEYIIRHQALPRVVELAGRDPWLPVAHLCYRQCASDDNITFIREELNGRANVLGECPMSVPVRSSLITQSTYSF